MYRIDRRYATIKTSKNRYRTICPRGPWALEKKNQSEVSHAARRREYWFSHYVRFFAFYACVSLLLSLPPGPRETYKQPLFNILLLPKAKPRHFPVRGEQREKKTSLLVVLPQKGNTTVKACNRARSFEREESEDECYVPLQTSHWNNFIVRSWTSSRTQITATQSQQSRFCDVCNAGLARAWRRV